MICTGFALYSQGDGHRLAGGQVFGWVFSILPQQPGCAHLHHLGMWVHGDLHRVHIYAAVREDIMSRQSMISSMISGDRYFRDDAG